MARGSFETPDGEDIEIDADDVIGLSAGEDEGTTVIELEDGDEVTVVATRLEVVAELGLDPLEYVEPEDDDALDDLDDDDDLPDDE